jgi:hypothetical protein
VSLVSRRAVLRASAVGAAGLLLAACTGGDGGPAPTAPGGPEDPDRALRAEIGRSETELVELYAATAALVPPATSAAVRELGARHEAYRQAIDPDGLATATPTASGTSASAASGTASPTSGAGASPLPLPTGPLTASAAAALLRSAELSAARARVPQSVRAVDEELARVIALAGAGSAAAAEQLREGLA